MGLAALPVMAHTDLLNENFDGDWTLSFSTLELDHNSPNSDINALFTNAEGVSQPWWVGKDDSNDTDRFFISHSYYNRVGKSNDWAVSNALTVPSEGFVLSFDAQSLPIRSGSTHALSDLWIFITDKPVTSDWQPAAADATYHLEKIPMGDERDVVKDDFQHYEYNLDAYKGKTIYISFANLNTDKDILVMDNVLVRRLDNAEVSASAPEYILHGDFPVEASVKGTTDEGLTNWTLTFECGDKKETKSGSKLTNGQEENYTFTGTVGSDQTVSYKVTLSADGVPDMVAEGETSGLAFQTTRRILLEESTGVWCGNCPIAMYTIEQVEKEEPLGERILPVSIHVGNDPMSVTEYETMFGVGTNAPIARVNRDLVPVMFGNNDFHYDVTNENSAAYKILQYFDNESLADIAVSGEYLTNAGKITGIDVNVDVTPAMTVEGSGYRIGLILTENNVNRQGAPRSVWQQHNYLSGSDEIDPANPFYSLPADISNMYFQDVARAIYGYYGEENTMPDRTIAAGEKVSYNTQVAVPDIETVSPNGTVTIPAINTDNLYITAFLMDASNNRVVNAVRAALSDKAESKITAADVLDIYLGVDSVENEADGEAAYYNMQGMRVLNPTPGIYVVRRGSAVTKEVIR